MQQEQLLEIAERFRVDDILAVERREKGSWAVVHGKADIINTALVREPEPSVVQRSADFIDRTRFTLERAFEIAVAFQERVRSPEPIRTLDTVYEKYR